MTVIELVGVLITSFGVGWFVGRGIKAVRQFLDLI